MKIVLFAAAMIAATISHASAQQMACAPLNDMAKVAAEFGEKPMATAQTPNGTLIIFANQNTQTWTAIVTDGGRACLVGTGGGFKLAPDAFGAPT
ncbi:hypothetical protein [Pseudohoeflea coraliihabitans]|uniref:Uncharacterized protein n=1 Tax=Pseudohoeflea coraliihabitans TaxID=2860393 RepID=A0ABS6WTB5_9HYPH|nr:hypothetical protein [Pseudohoeflea sp. DP4N28-3]MBW3099204.1 hypothetical protein [Pseudohoeflea sp. DP4N28-3]